jgi:hypothetical protein
MEIQRPQFAGSLRAGFGEIVMIQRARFVRGSYRSVRMAAASGRRLLGWGRINYDTGLQRIDLKEDSGSAATQNKVRVTTE